MYLPKRFQLYFGRRLIYHLSDTSAMIQNIIKEHNNSNNQLTSADVRKILKNNVTIIYKNNNKNDYKT